MKILAFAATNSKESINKKLIGYASRLLEEGMAGDVEIQTLDLNDYEMPIYSIDRQNEGGIPQVAQDFYDAITQADAVLIAFAEHNGFYTAAYKNLFDWASRIDRAVYQGKPTVMLSTSPGGGGGANVLNAAVQSGQFFGNDVRASLAIPDFFQNFDTESGGLRDPELDAQFRDTVAALVGVCV